MECGVVVYALEFRVYIHTCPERRIKHIYACATLCFGAGAQGVKLNLKLLFLSLAKHHTFQI